MAKGRKPSPTNLKVIKGTFRKDRVSGDTPLAMVGGMASPDWLPREAVEYFGVMKARIEELGFNSSTYTEALAMIALRLHEIDETTRSIAKTGATYETISRVGEPIIKSHPAVIQRSEAMRHLQSLLAEFGLTPAAISKLGGAKQHPKNPFKELLGG